MQIRSLLIWGVIALVLVVVFALVQDPSGGTRRELPEITYTEMLRRVEAGEVERATTTGRAVAIRLTDGRSYVSYVPEGAMSETVRRLYEANVEIKAAREARGPTFGDILLGILPMLLLIAAWFFFMRQMQTKRQDSLP